MKKLLLVVSILLLCGCDIKMEEIVNPNGDSLTYKYFVNEKYKNEVYNIKLKQNDSEINICKDHDNVYYEISGNMNLIIIEKDNLRYNLDTVNHTYSEIPIITKENYAEGILPEDIDKMMNKGYFTGKEKIKGHKYIFEIYEYDKIKVTYYFKNDKLKYIKKQTDTEDLLYEVLDFNVNIDENKFNLPENYMELTY